MQNKLKRQLAKVESSDEPSEAGYYLLFSVAWSTKEYS